MKVDRAWLHARGMLHDAHVTRVTVRDGVIQFDIDDEWANEHDGDPSLAWPGSISFAVDSAIEGSFENIEGGWISEIDIERDETFKLSFCDRDQFVIRSSNAEWTPKR